MNNEDLSQKYAAQRRNILSDKSPFAVQEAYKTLRTNVRFSLPGEGCKKICITSAMAGDGKSISTLNLAISFAQSGQRVLLIDGDMRRPTLSKLLIEKANPGLSNVLAGLSTTDDTIHTNVYTNLDVMLSGDIPPNPSELLGSRKMEQLLEDMSKCYDYILIDTPPVGIVTDTSTIAHLLDGVLFVIWPNRTDRDVLKDCLTQLEMAEGKILGFIVNGSSNDSKSKYYNSRRYKYGYKYGGYKYGYKYAYKYGDYDHPGK